MKILNNNIQNSLLFQKPVKTLPDELIYKTKTTIADCIHSKNSERQELQAYMYKMVDLKRGGIYAGEMIAAPVWYQNPAKRFYQIPNPYKSLYIDLLKTTESGMGYGTRFINIAKIESKKYDCGGKIHLIASRLYDRTRPPHIFYKKCGFISRFAGMNSYLDECIRLHKPMAYSMSNNLDMFLPIALDKHNVLSKLVAFLNALKLK